MPSEQSHGLPLGAEVPLWIPPHSLHSIWERPTAGPCIKDREQNNCRAFESKVNKPGAPQGQLGAEAQSNLLFLAFSFKSRSTTGTFDHQALKKVTSDIQTPRT